MNTVYTSRQLVKLTELMEQHGMTPEILTQNLADGRLADIFAYAKGKVDRAKLHKAFGPLPLPSSVPNLFTEIKPGSSVERSGFEIEVDYNLTLQEMIKRQRFCNVDDRLDLRQHTPRGLFGSGVHKKQIEPLWFGNRRNISIADIKEWYRPDQSDAVIEDLLAFGHRYRELARHFAIVAPGATNGLEGRDASYRNVFFLFECEHGGLDIGARSVNTSEWSCFPKADGAIFLTVRK